MRKYAVVLCFLVFSIVPAIHAQEYPNQNQQGVWGEFLATNPSDSDFLYCFHDFQNPYKDWCAEELLGRNTYLAEIVVDGSEPYAGRAWEKILSGNNVVDEFDRMLGLLNSQEASFPNEPSQSRDDFERHKTAATQRIISETRVRNFSAHDLGRIIFELPEEQGILLWDTFLKRQPEEDDLRMMGLSSNVDLRERAAEQLLTMIPTTRTLIEILFDSVIRNGLRTRAGGLLMGRNLTNDELSTMAGCDLEPYGSYATKELLGTGSADTKNALFELMRKKPE